MVKDKHIISEIEGYFRKNDYNKTTNYIMDTIRHLHLRLDQIDFKK